MYYLKICGGLKDVVSLVDNLSETI